MSTSFGIRERKSATGFSFPGRSFIVISNSYNRVSHLVTLPFVIGLFAKYLMADRSVVRPKGTLYDVIVSIDSWKYPTDFLIINPKN